jgi:integrase
MALTDTAVRQARPAGKDYKLRDSDGLALLVRAGGGKAWDFRFYWASEQSRISLGTYPEVSLKEARERREQARALIAKGVDPRVHRRQARQLSALGTESTFKAVFDRWRDFKALSLKTGRQSTLSQIDRIFAKDVLPWLRQISVFDVTRMDLLDVVRRIERKAFSTAEKCRTWFNQLFRYAIVEFGLETNLAADLDIVAVPQPPVRHNPFLRMADMPAFLKKLGGYGGALNTRLGLRLLLPTGVRTGELRLALPEQFDLERGLWIIPPVVVKQRRRRALRRLSGGHRARLPSIWREPGKDRLHGRIDRRCRVVDVRLGDALARPAVPDGLASFVVKDIDRECALGVDTHVSATAECSPAPRTAVVGRIVADVDRVAGADRKRDRKVRLLPRGDQIEAFRAELALDRFADPPDAERADFDPAAGGPDQRGVVHPGVGPIAREVGFSVVVAARPDRCAGCERRQAGQQQTPA